MADPESALLSGALSFNADADGDADRVGDGDTDAGGGSLPRAVERERERERKRERERERERERKREREHEREREHLDVDDCDCEWDDCMRATDTATGDEDDATETRSRTRTVTSSALLAVEAESEALKNENHEDADAKDHKTKSITLIQIHAPLLFDSLNRVLVRNQVVWVHKPTGVILKIADADAAGVRRDLDLDVMELRGEREGGEGEGEGKGKGKRGKREINIEKIELGEGTVLIPGLVDVHVHLFLHPYTETPWTLQLTGEPLAERVIRATVHARKTLMSGVTCVRDLGTEGAHDADLALRSSMAGRTPLIAGPRYYCATRAIVASGSYGPKNAVYPDKDGVDGVVGAVAVDGVDSCVREVRRQIGMGADWVKIYADYSPLQQTPLSRISPNLAGRTVPTFTREEMGAMIDAAHSWGVKIAAHANSAGVVRELVRLGVDSVEHGSGIVVSGGGGGDDDSVLRELAKAGGKKGGKEGGKTVWVPTLAAYYTSSLGGTRRGKEMWESCVRTFRRAVALVLDDHHSGVSEEDRATEFEEEEERERECKSRKMDNIAVGGDTGVFAHGTNALEMVLMRRLGAEWERVLAWATVGGWRCVRGMEWEGVEGRERVRRAEEVARALWGDFVGDDDDDDDDIEDDEEDNNEDDVEEEEEEEIDLERGTPFGAIRAGWAADLVAVKGKVDGTPEEFESAFMRGVDFVMKGGVVYKRDGKELVVG